MRKKRTRKVGIIALMLPLLIYWCVMLVAEVLGGALVVMLKWGEIETLYESGLSTNVVMTKLSNELLSYSLQITGLAAVIMIPIACYMIWRDHQTTWVSSYGQPEGRMARPGIMDWREGKPPWYAWPLMIIGGIAFNIVLNNLISLSNLAAYSGSYENASRALYSAGFPIQLLCGAVLIPIAEELVYRGLIFKRMLYKYPAGFAMFWAALLFALVHGNLVQIVFAFFAGLFLCYIYEGSGNIGLAMAFHMSINGTSYILTKVGGYSLFAVHLSLEATITILSAAALILIFLIFRQFIKFSKKKKLSDNL